MALNSEQKLKIQHVIKTCLQNKFQNYKPESSNMPFHFRLLGKDRMALYSFIHSLNTSFGTSIFEPVAVTLAQNRFKKAQSQFVVGTKISEIAQTEIQHIINDLTTGKNPDKIEEIDVFDLRGMRVKKVSDINCNSVKMNTGGLMAGVYLIRCYNPARIPLTVRFVKK